MAEKNVTMYVYYKIPTDERLHYLSAVENLNHDVKTSYPFLEVFRQKRPDLDAEKRELWMETYQGIPTIKLEKFTADLIILAEKNGLPKERKHEVFISL